MLLNFITKDVKASVYGDSGSYTSSERAMIDWDLRLTVRGDGIKDFVISPRKIKVTWNEEFTSKVTDHLEGEIHDGEPEIGYRELDVDCSLPGWKTEVHGWRLSGDNLPSNVEPKAVDVWFDRKLIEIDF